MGEIVNIKNARRQKQKADAPKRTVPVIDDGGEPYAVTPELVMGLIKICDAVPDGIWKYNEGVVEYQDKGLWQVVSCQAELGRFIMVARRYFRGFLKLALKTVPEAIDATERATGAVETAIYTAEDIGAYKPDRRNFTYMLEHLREDLGLEPDDILHTAQSLFHDHVPASDFGLAKAWIDRQLLAKSGDWGATAQVAERPEVDFYFTTMGEMAAAVEAA